MKRIRFFLLTSVLILLAFQNIGEAQEKYPTRPIELVVPFGSGGSPDLLTRIYSEQLAQYLKVPISVVNRPGGAGITGTNYVAKASKDGYTLLSSPLTPLVIMPALTKEIPYDPLKDLIPLACFAYVPGVFTVRTNSPFNTLGELIEYARKNPGKLKSGSAGLGSESFFNLAILCAKNNIKITTIPFDSGGEIQQALLGGHIDMAPSTVSTQGPHIKAGSLRGLAIISKTRHPDFPSIPTTAELGYPYVNFPVWIGVFSPGDLPQPVMNTLTVALEKVFKNPELVNRATKAGFTADYMGSEEFRKFIEMKIQVVEEVVKDAGLTKK